MKAAVDQLTINPWPWIGAAGCYELFVLNSVLALAVFDLGVGEERIS